MEDQKLNDLIKKYIDDSGTDAEKAALHHWYNNKADQELISPYQDLSEEVESKDIMLNNLLSQIRRQPITYAKSKRWIWYSVAASLLIALTAGIVFNLQKSIIRTKDTTNLMTKTKKGERRKIVLADGSIIWLSSGSSIKYPSTFAGVTRDVTFTGEAFFSIAHDRKHPFIVHTGKTEVQVLGTTFHINAYDKQKSISVSLITGKVSFTDGKIKQELSPGKRITYTIASGIIKLENIPDTALLTARRNGIYEYRYTRVEEIADDINRNFDVKVNVEGDVKDCLFYGRIKPGESPEKFLYKLGKVVNAEIIRKKNIYIIKGGGCNL